MRARTYKAAHRNLADSKRSIVMICAGLAMVLGTTSVGASIFSLGGKPTLIERTGASVVIDANGENEVPLDEPTVQILQGQVSVIPRKAQTSVPDTAPSAPLQVGSIAAKQLIDQIHQPNNPPPPTSGNNGGGQNTGDTGGDDGGDTGSGDAGEDPTTDPDDTAGGDTGGVEEDPAIDPDDTIIADEPDGSAPVPGSSLQGPSSPEATII